MATLLSGSREMVGPVLSIYRRFHCYQNEEQSVNAFLIVAAAIPTKILSRSSARSDQSIFAGDTKPVCRQ
jgi:hypothetical protein